MAIKIVVRVPGWRTFVFHWPGLPQLLHDAVAKSLEDVGGLQIVL